MKLKDILKENSVLVSPIKTLKPVGTIEMATIVNEDEQQESRKIDTEAFLGMVNRFGRIGEDIKVNDLRSIANVLKNVAETAKVHTESLKEDWFDKVTVSRNMKELNTHSKQFSKIAEEAASLQERMQGLYEDMGNIIGRYYEISEDITEDSDYETFFQSALKKFDASSPADMDNEKKKKFFNYVDKNYDAKNENLNEVKDKAITRRWDEVNIDFLMGVKDIQDMFDKKNDRTSYQILNKAFKKVNPWVDKLGKLINKLADKKD